MSLQNHWNEIFETTKDEKLGWYEGDFSQTNKFLKIIPNLHEKNVFISGVGTTGLVDELTGNVNMLLLNDISYEAISILKKRLRFSKQDIEYITSDISKKLPIKSGFVDLWIDRAVLHFLREPIRITGYFYNASRVIKSGGYLLLAEFADNGAEKCAGLELHRYTIEEMVERCGEDFELVKYEPYTYYNPYGEARPYIYSLFRRI